MLIEDGANPKEVMVEMGHSNIAMTYDLYGHLFTDEDADTRRAERAGMASQNRRHRNAGGAPADDEDLMMLSVRHWSFPLTYY